MDAELTIGELAKAAEVPTSTVRYYERAGLVQPAGRSRGNYRVYSEASLQRLRFIRAAQAAGFTLDNVRVLLELADGSTSPCGAVQSVIEERLSAVSARMSDLGKVERVLKASIRMCRRAEKEGHCEVLDELKAISAGPKTRRPRKR